MRNLRETASLEGLYAAAVTTGRYGSYSFARAIAESITASVVTTRAFPALFIVHSLPHGNENIEMFCCYFQY